MIILINKATEQLKYIKFNKKKMYIKIPVYKIKKRNIFTNYKTTEILKRLLFERTKRQNN